jgi:hypothetical protein
MELDLGKGQAKLDIKKNYTIGKYFTLTGDTINGLSPCDLIGSWRNPLKSYLIPLTIHKTRYICGL